MIQGGGTSGKVSFSPIWGEVKQYLCFGGSIIGGQGGEGRGGGTLLDVHFLCNIRTNFGLFSTPDPMPSYGVNLWESLPRPLAHL